jgi:hypothetical protein
MFFRDYKAWRLLLKILETTGTVVIRLYDRNTIALKSWEYSGDFVPVNRIVASEGTFSGVP